MPAGQLRSTNFFSKFAPLPYAQEIHWLGNNMPHRRPNIVCTLGPGADLFHVARTVTGLCRCEARNLIDLSLRLSSAVGEHSILLECDGTTAGIDLSDYSDRLMPELSGCDLYFKRCVRLEDLKPGGRIQPFGLNYACRSTRATLRLLGLFGPADAVRRRGAWKKFLCVPLFTAFERGPALAASPTILFQARLWDLAECPGDENVNEERVRLLLALRSAFKDRLAGGLVPTLHARRHYSELLTDQPSRQSRYVRWAREHLISIGFRGLFGSLGFKVAEAFAASQCLVSEPTTSYLPADAPHVRYRSVEECVTICDRFLTHPDEANQLRNQAWEYYRTAVEPEAHIKKLLGAMQ